MKFTTVASAAILGITGSNAVFHGTLFAGDIQTVGTPDLPIQQQRQQTLIMFDKDHEIVYSCAIEALEFCTFDAGCTCEMKQQNNVAPGGTELDFGVKVFVDDHNCVNIDFQGALKTNKLSCCGAFPCSLRHLES